MQQTQQFDLKNFLPQELKDTTDKSSFSLQIKDFGKYLSLSYETTVKTFNSKDSSRKYSDTIKRFIHKSKETFEVLGYLQAEMGKTQTGILNFCNHEYQIINRVLTWFKRELDVDVERWKWYIKVNMQKPDDLEYKKQIEEILVDYWIANTSISPNQQYPNPVSYIETVNFKSLSSCDRGTLIIEFRDNILSQVIKKFVRDITYNEILNCTNEQIRYYMRGIIAGEGCVQISRSEHKYVVKITAIKEAERKIYVNCLQKLGIASTDFTCNSDVHISRKENLLKLLQLKLVCGSPEKYNKFLRIFHLYDSFPEYNNWREKQIGPANKFPREVIDRIIEIHNLHSDWSSKKIGQEVGVSEIKVCRVRKEHGLGKRLVKLADDKRREIAEYAKNNPNQNQAAIAQYFNISQMTVCRALKFSKVCRSYGPKARITLDKIEQVRALYKENPAIKFNEVLEKVDISGTALKKIRRKCGLSDLGFMHLIGCNNPNKEEMIKKYKENIEEKK